MQFTVTSREKYKIVSRTFSEKIFNRLSVFNFHSSEDVLKSKLKKVSSGKKKKKREKASVGFSNSHPALINSF